MMPPIVVSRQIRIPVLFIVELFSSLAIIEISVTMAGTRGYQTATWYGDECFYETV